MGNFAGHALPGCIFILFSIWGTVQIFRRYFQSLSSGGAPYVSTVMYPVVLCKRRRRIALDAVAGLFSCVIGIVVELGVAPSLRHSSNIGSINGQHGTVYFAFALLFVVYLLLPFLNIVGDMSENICYLALALAFLIEGLMFSFHLHGRGSIDVHLHILEVFAIFACAVVTLMEMAYRSNPLISLMRVYFTFLQGTWFWQVAYLLYNPVSNPWGDSLGGPAPAHTEFMEDSDEGTRIRVITMMFTWHMTFHFVMMLVSGVFIGYFYRRKGLVDEHRLQQYQGTDDRTNSLVGQDECESHLGEDSTPLSA